MHIHTRVFAFIMNLLRNQRVGVQKKKSHVHFRFLDYLQDTLKSKPV
uniref:Uncharacterized protein n=1 Tax=Anguilla anguilla TaxID=7936 RepID=A0A0E9WIQ2_ANGAN